MLLGLGTGSTVSHLLEVLAARVREGLRVRGVPTSVRTETDARRLGIPLTTLDESPRLDLCIDGADEVDPKLDCLKGLGGALVREKIVAAASERFVLIVDDSKMVARLGERCPVLIEVVPFAAASVLRGLREYETRPRLKDSKPWISDNGNALFELHTGPLDDAAALARRLEATPGILDHGLFLGMARSAYVASAAGVRRLDR